MMNYFYASRYINEKSIKNCPNIIFDMFPPKSEFTARFFVFRSLLLCRILLKRRVNILLFHCFCQTSWVKTIDLTVVSRRVNGSNKNGKDITVNEIVMRHTHTHTVGLERTLQSFTFLSRKLKLLFTVILMVFFFFTKIQDETFYRMWYNLRKEHDSFDDGKRKISVKWVQRHFKQ